MSDDVALIIPADSPFKDHVPQPWDYKGEKRYVLKRRNTFPGTYQLHNLNDEINDERGDLEKCLISYKLNGETHDLFTISDYFNNTYSFNPKKDSKKSRQEHKECIKGNVGGDLRERIARRSMKYFLRNHSPHGDIGDLLEGVTAGDRDGFLIANNDTYVLKILRYPNMVLLRKDEKGSAYHENKLGYENIKELDGLFDYRYFLKQHLIIIESKSDGIDIEGDKLITNLFMPMNELFPKAKIHYILFANERNLFSKVRTNITTLNKSIVPLHEMLIDYGIQPLYFTFSENKEDIQRMTAHLCMQHDIINKQGVEFTGRIIHTHNDLIIFDAGQTPHMRLERNQHTGFWKEITRFSHKNGRKKKNNNNNE